MPLASALARSGRRLHPVGAVCERSRRAIPAQEPSDNTPQVPPHTAGSAVRPELQPVPTAARRYQPVPARRSLPRL